jgi:UDP-glucose 4-epimerase
MKNILITGGLGFIGLHLARSLSKKYNVSIIDTKNGRVDNKNIKIYNYDFSSKKTINIIKTLNIDTVLHLAAYTNVAESEKKRKKYFINNYYKSKIFFKQLNKLNCVNTFLFASSAAVYGDKNYKVSEKSHCVPKSYYGLTKLLFENFLLKQKTKINIKVTRFFNIISNDKKDYKSKTFFNKLVDSIKNKKKFYIYGHKLKTPDGYCYRDFIEIKNLIKIIIKLLKLNKKKIIVNIATGKSTSIGNIVNLVKKNYSKNFNYEILPVKKGEIIYSCSNVNKLKKLLNLKKILTVNFVESLKKRLKN